MYEEIFMPEQKIEKLATKISKAYSLSEEEAMEVIYEEWDLVENLFHVHSKVQTVYEYLCEEINYTYRIA